MNPFLFIIALFTIWELFLELPFDIDNPKNTSYKVCDIPAIFDGDLVFRRGRSIESYVVLSADGNVRYSHVGIACIDEKGQCAIVHAVPADDNTDNKVRIEPLSTFWAHNNSSAGAVYRLSLNGDQRKTISNYVKDILAAKIKFDGAYDLHDSSKLYCTELIRNAYQYCGIDILDGNMDTIWFPKHIPIIFPGTLLKNNNIKQVYSYPYN